MLVMLTARYPATSVKRVIEVYMSPETPKRPDSGREVCSFVHGDHTGYTNYFVFDVEDRHLAEFLVDRDKIWKIQSPVQCCHLIDVALPALGEMQIVDVKMNDVELVPLLPQPFNHQKMVG